MTITKTLFSALLLAFYSLNFCWAQYPLAGMTHSGGKYNGGVIFITHIDSNLVAEHSFVVQNEGSNPEGSLMEASNGKFYGMTVDGGENHSGVIFEFDPISGAYAKKHDFNYYDGKFPKGSLIEVSNGKLYGMTSEGGNNHKGSLFEYDPVSETFSKKIDFDGTNGSSPYGSLIQGSNDKLYGLTSSGGAYDQGVLFEFNPSTNNFTIKFDFSQGSGSEPHGSLMQASDGKIYGMTSRGGINNEGVLFEFDLATNNYSKKFDFGGNNGSSPYGSLIQANNGKLYGMTFGGGRFNPGVIFEFDPFSGNYAKKYDFDFINGGNPKGSLIQAFNGKLYGLAANSTGSAAGVLFEYDLSTNSYLKKVEFNSNGGNTPYGSLLEASNGKLYGLTSEGGIGNAGTLFEYNPGIGTYTTKIDFEVAIDGKNPWGALTLATNGKLYGMTRNGGIHNVGVLFEFDPSSGVYTKKFDFGGANGGAPYGSLLLGFNGSLYGMTTYGGGVFEYNPDSDTYSRYDFSFEPFFPRGKLMQATNGKLYGMTSHGGVNHFGVLFEYDPFTNYFSKKYDFNGADGCFPEGALVQAFNGKLYGMTPFYGGANFYNYGGVLFEYDLLTDNFTKKVDFIYGDLNGNTPKGSLVQGYNNKLYGMTSMGGARNLGVIFEYDPSSSTYIKKIDLDMNGYLPYGSLFNAVNNKLYGMAAAGGAYGMGIIFEYDPLTNDYKKLFDFNGSNGKNPISDLIQICNLPEAAGTIAGNLSVCQGEKGVVYTIPEIKNASGYNWILPPGATISSGHNTNSITVDFIHVTRGDIRVVGTNECGNGIISPKLKVLAGNCNEIDSSLTNRSATVIPNPNEGLFNIEIKLQAEENLTIKVFNMQGDIVFSEQLDHAGGKLEKIIDISKHSSGIYHLHIISPTETLNKKVVVY